MNTSRGRYLAELRRSGAAGIHDTQPTRAAVRQAAIKEELGMSILDQDHVGDWIEPTIEDLDEIENEEDYVPSDLAEVDFFDDYDYDGFNTSNYLEH